MLPPTPPDAVQSASLASGSGKAKTKAPSKPISDKPWDSSKVPAAPSRSPARPSPDREAKSAHIEARSELLSLIASHAAEELGDELGAAAMVDVALPPPKLALAEAAARKKAAADAEEERARRQAAVEKLADRVAKHNDTRARRVPRSGDDAEVESTSAAFRPPSAATPSGSAGSTLAWVQRACDLLVLSDVSIQMVALQARLAAKKSGEALTTQGFDQLLQLQASRGLPADRLLELQSELGL